MKNNLISFNIKMGFLHLVQGTTILILGLTISEFKNFRPTIYARFLEVFEGGGYGPVTQKLFDLPFAIMVALFLLLSSFFHFFNRYTFKK